MATTYNEDGTSKTTSNTNRGMTAWMPPPPKKEKKEKPKSLIEKLKERKEETNRYIDMLN